MTKQLIVFIACLLGGFCSTGIYAQTIEVTGTVTDNLLEPIPGANVLIKGTTVGTFTDIDGNYAIMTAPDAVLEFSSLGFLNRSIKVNGKAVLDVILESDTESIEETVVIAYGTKSKASITGALSSVETKQLLQSPATSVTNMLAGSLPGVSAVQTSGQPGKDVGRIKTVVIKSFKEVRDMVVGTDAVVEYEVEDDIILEGVVVSNPLYGNAGENEQTNNTSIDYTGAKRTIYLQSLDGKYGFALMAASAEDNVFNQFDKVQVLLKGTKITKYSSPERYVISGFVKRMKASQVPATESEIVKEEKYFKDLTPEDIYTYKTLKDVEFPVRKGSLTPINEGYAIGGKSDRISKYPLLVRDVNGDSFYMYTNTMCTYRYDGERLPQGSGKLSGVIVHERFSRFEWENGKDLLDMEIFPELGNIGTYQIRHQQKSDITDGMAMDFKDSFSELLLEYRYWNPDSQEGVMRPSYGTNGWFTHTYQQKYTGSASLDYTAENHYNQHLMPEVSFSYLGKVGISGNEFFEPATGNVNGFGIVLDSENDQYNIEMSDWVGEHNGKNEWMAPLVSDSENGIRDANGGSQGGKGQCPADCYCAFRNVYWWDFEAGRGYAWMLNFSTKNVSKSLSLQFTALNTSQLFYSPRFWKIEWSEVDSMAASDDDKWHLITEYTVPDISQWTGTLYSSCVGYKAMDVRLPDELLGKDNVYIRFMPTSVACSSGADYTDTVLDDDAHYESGKHSSSIDYISIRYNK